MKCALALLTLCLIATASGCQKPDKVNKIYFVPIGNAPTAEIDNLVEHYRQKFGIEITVLPALAPRPSEINQDRHQLIAEHVATLMHDTYSQTVNIKSSVLIGVTTDDMYMLGENWRFCFGLRRADLHSAVVSTARMNLHYPEEPATQANITSRLQKMVTKDIGILYYGKRQSGNPHSVLFNGIMGIQELDQVSEDF